MSCVLYAAGCKRFLSASADDDSAFARCAVMDAPRARELSVGATKLRVHDRVQARRLQQRSRREGLVFLEKEAREKTRSGQLIRYSPPFCAFVSFVVSFTKDTRSAQLQSRDLLI